MFSRAVPAASGEAPPAASAAQPNELDRRRILRRLEARTRYKYVSPSVRAVQDGYLIESPCCSRRVDPDGGVVDVAWIEHQPGEALCWALHNKDHELGQWQLHSRHARLQELLELLNADPQRLFWQ